MPNAVILEQAITETATVEAPEQGTGRMLVQLISPGQGSSGYYRPEVLETAATDKIFPAGTHMYLDHPGPGDRPERSLRDLIAVLDEDASWTGEALVAAARVFEPYRELVTEMKDDIGVSIRASADTSEADVEGKRTRVIERITKGLSVDFVTRAGRGGRILEILESAREVTETTASDLADALSTAAHEKYGTADDYAWVRDYDPDKSLVWISHDGSTYQQSFTYADGVVELAGDRTEVTVRTQYVPVSEAELPAPHPPSLEDNMPEITEAEVQALREAGTTAETERDVALRERDEARAELATLRRQEAARPIAAAVLAESTTLGALARSRVVESLVTAAPETDAGDLDEAALRTAAEAARTAAEAELAEVLAEGGAGRPRGLGEADLEEGVDAEYFELFPDERKGA